MRFPSAGSFDVATAAPSCFVRRRIYILTSRGRELCNLSALAHHLMMDGGMALNGMMSGGVRDAGSGQGAWL